MRFVITETQVYEVEADTEEKALEMLFDNQLDPIDQNVEIRKHEETDQ